MDGKRGRYSRAAHGPGRGGVRNRIAAEPRRVDKLAQVVDRCLEAQQVADELNEKFLSYLLAMAIQETRSAMRQEVKAAADIEVAPGAKRLPD